MTREEAITVLKGLSDNPLFSDQHRAAFNIAIHDIKAHYNWAINNLILINKDNYEPLDQEPTTKNDLGVDCISRDVVKNYIQAHIHEIITESGEDKNKHTNRILRSMIHGVNCMPSVTPQPCEDAVSRQEVLDLIADYDLSMGQVVRGIHALPPVTPQEPKTGHWITKPHVYGVTYCSECDFELRIDNTNYCPNCGAKMAESEEK